VAKALEAIDQLLGLEESFLAEDRVEDHRAFRGELELLLVQVASKDGANGLIRHGLPALGGDLGEAGEDVGGLRHL
jgi:hypothetical protein